MFPNFTQGPAAPPSRAVTRCQRSQRQCLCRSWTRKARSKNVRLAAVPAFSVELEPGEQVVPIANGSERSVKVGVVSNLMGASNGSLRLEVPAGWRVEPNQIAVTLRDRGDKKDFDFKVIPGDLKEEHTHIRAVLTRSREKLQRRLQLRHSRRPGQRLLLSTGGAARQHCGCEGPERPDGGIHPRSRRRNSDGTAADRNRRDCSASRKTCQ